MRTEEELKKVFKSLYRQYWDLPVPQWVENSDEYFKSIMKQMLLLIWILDGAAERPK